WISWTLCGREFGRLTAFSQPFSDRSPSEIFWSLVLESHVRPDLIVVHAPGLYDRLNLGQGTEPMDVKAFVAQRSIERLDEAVIGWLAWPAKVDLGLVVIGPEIEHLAREFAAIIDKQIFRRLSLADYPVQCRHYV